MWAAFKKGFGALWAPFKNGLVLFGPPPKGVCFLCGVVLVSTDVGYSTNITSCVVYHVMYNHSHSAMLIVLLSVPNPGTKVRTAPKK